MNIFILANEQQEKELGLIKMEEKSSITIYKNLSETKDYKNYDVFFLLQDFSDLNSLDIFENKPVIINEVTETLTDLKLPGNFHRINGWPGFLQREVWEVASKTPDKIKSTFDVFKKKIFFVEDEPGFVSARVISMIINEAFFALGENVSTKEEIDLAMKAGTNYPFGPFEWAEKIGIANILKLLKKLSEKEERYLPAPALESFFQSQNNV